MMKGQEKRGLVPKLRFPEFRGAGAWVEKALSDKCRVTQGGTPDTTVSAFWGGSIQWITPAEMGKISNKYIAKTVRSITKEGLANCSSELLPKNSIIISTRAPIGHLAINQEQMAINQGCHGLVPNVGVDAHFIYYTLDKSRGILNDLGSGNTFKELSGKALKNFVLPYPAVAEQQKIADCLSSIDELITSEAQYLDTLKTHKKGLMQQLFPEEGETVPRLRFPEFRAAGEWKRNQLCELVTDFLDGDWVESKDQSNFGIRLLQTGNIGVGSFISKIGNSRYISDETFTRLHCEEVFPGDCLISRLPDPAGRSCLVPDIGQRMITAVDCTIVRFDKTKIIPYLFVVYSQTDRYFREVESLCSGSTRQRISRDNLSQIELALPKLVEQQKIADCLSSLDELITAEAQYLDTLKTHKKGLMQQLFPA